MQQWCGICAHDSTAVFRYCESGVEGGMTLESNLRQAIAQGLVAAPAEPAEAAPQSAPLAVAAFGGDSLLQALQASQDHHKRLKAAEEVAKVKPDSGVATAAAAAAAVAKVMRAEDHAQSSLLGHKVAHAEVSPVTRAPVGRRGRSQVAAQEKASRSVSSNRRTRRKPERAAT